MLPRSGRGHRDSEHGWNPFEQGVRELEDAAELFLANDSQRRS